MDKIVDGGAAFPFPVQGLQDDADFSGMSLRDYFAAKAMQAWNANPNPDDTPIQEVAAWSYRMADAMLAARSGAQP